MIVPTKELHEVLKALRVCSSAVDGCARCPYYVKDGKNKCLSSEGNHMLQDAYYYLYKYQRNRLGI